MVFDVGKIIYRSLKTLLVLRLFCVFLYATDVYFYSFSKSFYATTNIHNKSTFISVKLIYSLIFSVYLDSLLFLNGMNSLRKDKSVRQSF